MPIWQQWASTGYGRLFPGDACDVVNGPSISSCFQYWALSVLGSRLDLSRSRRRDVIGHVSIRFPIGHFHFLFGVLSFGTDPLSPSSVSRLWLLLLRSSASRLGYSWAKLFICYFQQLKTGGSLDLGYFYDPGPTYPPVSNFPKCPPLRATAPLNAAVCELLKQHDYAFVATSGECFHISYLPNDLFRKHIGIKMGRSMICIPTWNNNNNNAVIYDVSLTNLQLFCKHNFL